MNKSAIFSSDRTFRYALIRVWDISKPKAMCIGLNPSTANSESDDPTINNLIQILTTLGYGGLYMTNLFGLISSKPNDLRSCTDPVRDNDKYLRFFASECDDVIFCWGDFKQAQYRVKIIAPMFPKAKCFGKNKNGTPMHPLALMYNGTVKSPKLYPWC